MFAAFQRSKAAKRTIVSVGSPTTASFRETKYVMIRPAGITPLKKTNIPGGSGRFAIGNIICYILAATIHGKIQCAFANPLLNPSKRKSASIITSRKIHTKASFTPLHSQNFSSKAASPSSFFKLYSVFSVLSL